MIKFALTVLQVASVLGKACETVDDCKRKEDCAGVSVISGSYKDDPKICVKETKCNIEETQKDGSVYLYICGYEGPVGAVADSYESAECGSLACQSDWEQCGDLKKCVRPTV